MCVVGRQASYVGGKSERRGEGRKNISVIIKSQKIDAIKTIERRNFQ